jgi:hypothetical protein
MRSLLRRLRSERALALPFALLVMAISAASIVTVVQFSSSSGRTAHVAKGRMSAEALAEAGLSNAFAVLNYWDSATMLNNANDPTLLGCDVNGANCVPRVSTYTSGTASYYGVLNASTSIWTITSVGQVVNPTGGPALKKTLTAKVNVTWNNTQPANAAAWNYVYSTKTPGGGCEVTLNGNNVVLDMPLYVTGDLCFDSNNAVIDERGEGQTPAPQPIDVRVGGKAVFAANGTSIGVASDNITKAAVAGGCTTNINTAGTACNTSAWNTSRYFVDTTTTFTAITQPTADFAGKFVSASPGPNHDCVTASSPSNLAASTWDTDGIQDGNDGTFDLTPATSYQCKTYANDATSGTQIGELSWDATSHVLTVRGVIFIDKNVTSSATNATYQGSATLHVGGTYTFSGNDAKLCANATCDFTTWNPNTEMLIIVANGAGNAIDFSGNNDKFQGGLFCNPTATISFSGNNGEIQGPMICGSFNFSNNVVLKPLPAITELPLGAPINPNVHATPSTPSYGG